MKNFLTTLWYGLRGYALVPRRIAGIVQTLVDTNNVISHNASVANEHAAAISTLLDSIETRLAVLSDLSAKVDSHTAAIEEHAKWSRSVKHELENVRMATVNTRHAIDVLHEKVIR